MVVTNNRNSISSFKMNPAGLNKISYGSFKNLPTLWPDKFLCKMKYTDTINTTMSIGASGYMTTTIYRVNSLYDPLITSNLEQAMPGYSELAAMYSYYRVNAAKMTANVSVISGTVNPTLVSCGFSRSIPPFNGASNYTLALQTIGNPYVTWALTGSNYSPVYLENYISMKKLAGSIVTNTDDDYGSGAGTSPAYPLYGYVNLATPIMPSTAPVFNTIIEIEFWAEWYGRDFEST